MTAKRRVCYVTGTRADFGLMTRVLHAIQDDPRLSLSLLVTGMHLSEMHGATVSEVEVEGFPIAARVPVDMGAATGASMARNLGIMLTGFVDALDRLRPDLLLLLGDRGEMLAGALAGIHLGIPVVHLHGGERSGTVDEPVRHAISKLSHIHLVATEGSRDRLIRMGEKPSAIHVTGAPGLDGLAEMGAARSREALSAGVGFDSTRPIAVFLYHPVLQEASSAARDTHAAITAALDAGCQVLALRPNSDAGSDAVRQVLDDLHVAGRVHLMTHLPRAEFVAWLAHADVLVGNSSSGIIEAATFGTPVVNIGSRQNMRERNPNVIDVSPDAGALREAVQRALRDGPSAPGNVYGDGRAVSRITSLLATVPIDPALLEKCNEY